MKGADMYKVGMYLAMAAGLLMIAGIFVQQRERLAQANRDFFNAMERARAEAHAAAEAKEKADAPPVA